MKTRNDDTLATLVAAAKKLAAREEQEERQYAVQPEHWQKRRYHRARAWAARQLARDFEDG